MVKQSNMTVKKREREENRYQEGQREEERGERREEGGWREGRSELGGEGGLGRSNAVIRVLCGGFRAVAFSAAQPAMPASCFSNFLNNSCESDLT